MTLAGSTDEPFPITAADSLNPTDENGLARCLPSSVYSSCCFLHRYLVYGNISYIAQIRLCVHRSYDTRAQQPPAAAAAAAADVALDMAAASTHCPAFVPDLIVHGSSHIM